jgi:hypothetical protein
MSASAHPTTITPCSTDSSPSTTSETPKRSASPSSNAHDSSSDTTTSKTSSPTSSKKPGSSHAHGGQAHHPSAPTPANGYHAASSTGNGNGKTPATHPTPGSPKSASTIEWHNLTPSAWWTITYIATPIMNGYTEHEIAAKTGHTRTWVKHQLAQLRNELLAEEP